MCYVAKWTRWKYLSRLHSMYYVGTISNISLAWLVYQEKKIHPGDWALLFDSRFKKFKGNLTTHWLGPYEIEKVFENGSINVKTIDVS